MDIFVIIVEKIENGEPTTQPLKAFTEAKEAEHYVQTFYKERKKDEWGNFVDVPLQDDGSIPYEVYSKINEEIQEGESPYMHADLWVEKIPLVTK